MIWALVFYWVVAGFVCNALPRTGHFSKATEFFFSMIFGGFILPAGLIIRVIK